MTTPRLPRKSLPHILILAPAKITPPTYRGQAGMVETATPDPGQFLDLPRGRLARASLARLHGRATGSGLRREDHAKTHGTTGFTPTRQTTACPRRHV